MRSLWLTLWLVLLLAVPAGAFTVTRVTVTTTATLIYTAPYGTVGSVLVRNPSSTVSLFLGPAGVTTSTGFEVPAGGAVQINLYDLDRLYGVVTTGTVQIHTISGSNP